MDYKVQRTVFAVIFIIVGMMFLVPTTAEKALAKIEAHASGDCGPEGTSHKCLLTCNEEHATGTCIHFDNCSHTMGDYSPCGVIDTAKGYPTSGTEVTWATKSAPFPVGEERGVVDYKVDNDKFGRVSLAFYNPIRR